MSLLLFWLTIGVAAVLLSDAPRIQAVMRAVPFWSSEYLWRYNGPRPSPGQEVVLYARQGSRDGDSPIVLVARLGDADGPTTAPPLRTNAIDTNSLFPFGTLSVSEWPAGQELYLGYQMYLGSMTFFETGEWPNAPLDSVGWFRAGDGERFLRAQRAEFAALDVRMVPADAARPLLHSHRNLAWLSLFAGVLLAVHGLLGVRSVPREGQRLLCWDALLLVMAWHAVSALAPSQYLWTSFHVLRGGSEWFWMGLILVQVMVFPPLADMLVHHASGLCSRVAKALVWHRTGWIVALPPLVVGAVLLILFWSFPMRGTYGDAMGALNSPYAFGVRHNPLTCALFQSYQRLHPDFHALLLRFPGPSMIPDFSAWDIEVGRYFFLPFSLLYLVATYGMARQLARSPTRRWTLWLVLLSGKPLLVQFGYPEVYCPAVAILALATWLILRASRRGADPTLASAMAFIAYLSHFAIGPLLPAVMVLWWSKLSEVRWRLGWLLPRAAALSVLCLTIWCTTAFLLLWGKYQWNMDGYARDVPLGGLGWLMGPGKLPDEAPYLRLFTMHHWHNYPLVSVEHFSQWIGAVFFATGPVAPWLLMVSLGALGRLSRDLVSLGFVLSAALVTVPIFFIYNQFPYPRDWDLFVLPGFFWLTALLLIVMRGGIRPALRRWMLWSLLVYAAWDTGLWVLTNVRWGPPMVERLVIPL
jgi:hypothetical protein